MLDLNLLILISLVFVHPKVEQAKHQNGKLHNT